MCTTKLQQRAAALVLDTRTRGTSGVLRRSLPLRGFAESPPPPPGPPAPLLRVWYFCARSLVYTPYMYSFITLKFLRWACVCGIMVGEVRWYFWVSLVRRRLFGFSLVCCERFAVCAYVCVRYFLPGAQGEEGFYLVSSDRTKASRYVEEG